MYSLVFDFNLSTQGHDAERYLVSIIEEWPELYSEVPGVHGTIFMLNALGLGGDYSFRQVVELDHPRAIRGIDEGMQKNKRWAASRVQWLKHRKDARSYLLKHDDEETGFTERLSKPSETALVSMTSARVNGDGRKAFSNSLSSSLRNIGGVDAVRSYKPLVHSANEHGVQLWAMISDYDALADVGEAASRAIESTGAGVVQTSQVFGIMRAENGVFMHSA